LAPEALLQPRPDAQHRGPSTPIQTYPRSSAQSAAKRFSHQTRIISGFPHFPGATAAGIAMPDVSTEAARRRTFAIISHPDAGKTTLTEKLLLFGGAIQMAGSVKSRKTARNATSDWMALEKERGISVTSSVMQFPYEGRIINL